VLSPIFTEQGAIMAEGATEIAPLGEKYRCHLAWIIAERTTLNPTY